MEGRADWQRVARDPVGTFLLILRVAARAQDNFEITTYYIVFLKSGARKMKAAHATMSKHRRSTA
jgi:hypothetical protein